MYGKTGFNTKVDYDRSRYVRLKNEKELAKPTDPIMLLSAEDKAYIAGLIDGEGAIYMANHKGKTVYPRVAIHMTHEGVIRWVASIVSAEKVHMCRRKDGARYKRTTKDQYLFRISGKRAQLLCREIYPFMKVKNEHAKIVCDFPVDARVAPGAKISQSEINKVRYDLRDKLTALNGNRYALRHKVRPGRIRPLYA